jgi:hypothetical protein
MIVLQLSPLHRWSTVTILTVAPLTVYKNQSEEQATRRDRDRLKNDRVYFNTQELRSKSRRSEARQRAPHTPSERSLLLTS